MAKRRAEYEFSLRNASTLDREIARRAEKRIAVFSDLAYPAADRLFHAARRGLPRRTLLSSLGTLFPPLELHESVLPAQRELLSHALSPLSALDRVAMITAMLDRLTVLGAPITEGELLPIDEAPLERIAYFRNPYTDEAYDSFAATMKAPTVQYVGSFRASAEAVHDGTAGFCILPVANSEGALTPFTDMADSLSLVRVASTRVFHADGTDVTRFALYAAKFPPFTEDGVLCLRFSAMLADNRETAVLITVLSLLGASLFSFSVEEAEDGEDIRLAAVCRVTPENRIPLLCYLTAFTKDCRFLGFYKETE